MSLSPSIESVLAPYVSEMPQHGQVVEVELLPNRISTVDYASRVITGFVCSTPEQSIFDEERTGLPHAQKYIIQPFQLDRQEHYLEPSVIVLSEMVRSIRILEP